MNDPHVVALFYNIKHSASVDYREAKPRDYEEDNFSVRIEDKKVCFTMKTHYATEEEALEAVREYIKRWEFAAGLERGPDKFKLVYQEPNIVDRRPSPKSDDFADVSGAFRSPAETLRASISSLSQYPKPPSASLTITPDVQSMYDRFAGYRLGKELLPSMAYFCLTVLQGSIRCDSSNEKTAPDKKAAEMYRIERAVIKKIVSLSSNKGGPAARKAAGINSPLKPEEARFLEEAVKALIRRAAEVAHDPKNESRAEIKLSDLPQC